MMLGSEETWQRPHSRTCLKYKPMVAFFLSWLVEPQCGWLELWHRRGRSLASKNLMTWWPLRAAELVHSCSSAKRWGLRWCALSHQRLQDVFRGEGREKKNKKPNAIRTIVGRFCPSYHASLKLGHRRENPMSQCCTAGVFKKHPLIVTAHGRRPRRLISSGRGSACVNRSWP